MIKRLQSVILTVIDLTDVHYADSAIVKIILQVIQSIVLFLIKRYEKISHLAIGNDFPKVTLKPSYPNHINMRNPLKFALPDSEQEKESAQTVTCTNTNMLRVLHVMTPKRCTAELGRLPGRRGAWPRMRFGRE
jgi:hypothetical protein